MHVSVVKKIISYLYPVKIREGSSIENPRLELFLDQGQWQLSTRDAIYSDGSRYRPLVTAFNHIKKHLAEIDHVLVLGVGLGSAVTILDKMGCHPQTTLVDIDALILEWAEDLMPRRLKKKASFICEDADKFIKNTDQQYDMIIVDIFKGRLIPDFAKSLSFLNECKKSLSGGGFFIINFIIMNLEDWDNFSANFNTVFPQSETISLGINRILIARV